MSSSINYLTPQQVAEILMVSRETVADWCSKGQLRAFEGGNGVTKFLLDDVRDFADTHISLFQSPIKKNKVADNKRVLIVDDDPMFAEFLEDLISSRYEDIDVQVSSDGFDAGAKLKNFKPSVVLLDLMMPGFDGFRVCKQIKQDPLFRDITVLAMTGASTASVSERIIGAGASACLSKPINTDELFLHLAPKIKNNA